MSCISQTAFQGCKAGRTLSRVLLAIWMIVFSCACLPASAQPSPKTYSPEELDQILAPIALYDDALLSQVLMAATYPIEIVEADRWARSNPNLKGDAAVSAVADKSWDVSVKSLVAFPPILAQLSDHLDWTQKLGDAVIGQEQDVGASIQRLRAKAAAAGTLKSGNEQTVTTQSQGSDTVYSIQPTNPQVVYVPTYDPNTAYGQWGNSLYPPTYFPLGGALVRGMVWGAGFAATNALFGGWNWGGGGSGSYLNINPNRAINIDRTFNRTNVLAGDRWQHDTLHRRGVAYRDPTVQQRFGQVRPGVEQRQQYRGNIQRPVASNLANPRTGVNLGGTGSGGLHRPGGDAGGNIQRPASNHTGANLPHNGGVNLNAQRPGGSYTAPNIQRPAGAVQRPAPGGNYQRPGASNALAGVNRGQQVNREAQRGRVQQQKAAGSQKARNVSRPAGRARR